MENNHYLMEKALEEQNRNMERAARKWWKFSARQKPAEDSNKGVHCQAYNPRQA